jgi:hypothetical protein
MTKEAGADEAINVYLFVIQDAQINFEDGRFKEISYLASKSSVFTLKNGTT